MFKSLFNFTRKRRRNINKETVVSNEQDFIEMIVSFSSMDVNKARVIVATAIRENKPVIIGDMAIYYHKGDKK